MAVSSAFGSPSASASGSACHKCAAACTTARGSVSTPLLRCAIQARFASSRAGLCCRGTNLRSASAIDGSSAGDDSVACADIVSSASTGLLRSTRTCSRSPFCGPAASPDARRAGCRWPPMSSHSWPLRASRTATASRMAPTRHSASRLGLGRLPDPRRLTRSTRMLGRGLSLFRCELLQQFSGSRAPDLERCADG